MNKKNIKILFNNYKNIMYNIFCNIRKKVIGYRLQVTSRRLQVTSYRLQENGFTLIELIIYIGIIGAVAASFVSFSIYVSESRNKTYVFEEVQANSRTALNLMSQKIKMANGINDSSNDCSTIGFIHSLNGRIK